MQYDRIAWGIGFIVLGIILMLFSFGVFKLTSVGEAWKLWPVIFIIIGLALLFYMGKDTVEEVKE